MTSTFTESSKCFNYLNQVLQAKKDSGPVNLAEYIQIFAKLDGNPFKENTNILEIIVNHLETCDINDEVFDNFILTIQKWDHVENQKWAENSEKYSLERRQKMLSLLGFSPGQQDIVNRKILRFSESEIPIIIAENHTPWYLDRKNSITNYYWNDYIHQLQKPNGSWDSPAISILDISTDDVLSRLSDPLSDHVYPVKGLVVGYVQSGKTSHFNGLIAKAADAGYRLFIILSGTTDILRRQTQRRIDRDIIGHDITDFEEYGGDNDWPKFVTHEYSIQDGRFEWERLTNKSEYKSLRKHPSLLDFKRHNNALPFNHPTNLKYAKARIAVIKKVPIVINKLVKDLASIHGLSSKLDYVPTLIIDDESDQASINTIDQSKPGQFGERTKTNKAIGDLLKLLPRAQYVGYTATPFANVFIDPEDADDLFPKDFIISLQRPQGYMGGSDFYDNDEEFEAGDFSSNKQAFIRGVEEEDALPGNLPKAIDSFVLAGAIKLFREDKSSTNYNFKHHTMLIHHAAKQIVHDEDKQIVESIFCNGNRYRNVQGLEILRFLFETDFLPVSKNRAPESNFPRNFEEIQPYITKCLDKLTYDKPIRIINCSPRGHADEPDFEQSPIWAILVGGTKLSRGYTVEGLTTSYYRRPTGAGDTLMQMGRWYGFRNGYRDLVRLFLGTKEKRGKQTIDLYEAFGALVRSEDELRNELQKYSVNGIKPKQVPPLVHQFMPFLPPTSKNKMFNAVIKSKDFSGEYTEKVSASPKTSDKKQNLELARYLINSSDFPLGKQNFNFSNNRNVNQRFEGYLGKSNGNEILHFLDNFLWVDNKKSVYLETEYISSMLNQGLYKDWQLLLPQKISQNTRLFSGTKLGPLTTVARKLAFENTFEVYSEPIHREAAAFLCKAKDLSNPSYTLLENQNSNTPILIMYFVVPKENQNAEITVGFGIQYPGIKQDFSMVWGIQDSRNADLIVVDSNND